jgi:hypothetical protein
VSSNNTGEAQETPYVSVENLIGSRFADNLRGDTGNNSLRAETVTIPSMVAPATTS